LQSSIAVVDPVVSEYSFTAQVLSWHLRVLPPVENVPTLHSVHPVSAAIAPDTVVVSLPAGQFWSQHTVADAAEYDPAAHDKHTGPFSAEYVPAAHAAHPAVAVT